jgi:hypothetical protein
LVVGGWWLVVGGWWLVNEVARQRTALTIRLTARPESAARFVN